MEKQILVSIGREFGSGGHEIAERLANKLQIQMLDRRLIEEETLRNRANGENMEKYDEKPRNLFLSRAIHEFSSSIEENLAQKQFEYMREKAKAGESFVIVGRCSDYILREYPQLISCYITGELEHKIERVMRIYELNREDAIKKMKRHNRKRKIYYESFTNQIWASARNYDITANSSRFGVEGVVDFLYYCVQQNIVR